MTSFLPDTSCMIAAVCGWHVHHEPARLEFERRLDGGQKLISAWPALIETFSVLTRLPKPHRLRSEDALALVRTNFVDGLRSVALSRRGYESLLTSAPDRGTTGGRVYDAVIMACAVEAKVDVLLTFNERDFLSMHQANIEVVAPTRS